MASDLESLVRHAAEGLKVADVQLKALCIYALKYKPGTASQAAVDNWVRDKVEDALLKAGWASEHEHGLYRWWMKRGDGYAEHESRPMAALLAYKEQSD